jgi:hypothetical protein
VRNALVYVLHNARKHGLALLGIDPFSSGVWFDGWSTAIAPAPAGAMAVRVCARARSWLLGVGWRRHGPIDTAGVPGSERRRRREMWP